MIKPKVLLYLIISSFLLVLLLCGEAHNPLSVIGLCFWINFGIFAFCCIHLSKNEEYYKQFLDDDL